MNSIKNLIVIVMLLAVSYGAFQVINAPDLTQPGDSEDLNLSDGSRLAGGPNPQPVQMQPDGFPELPPMVPMAENDSFQIPDLVSPQVPEQPSSELANDSGSFEIEIEEPSIPNAPSGFDSTTANNGQFQPKPETSLTQVTPKGQEAPQNFASEMEQNGFDSRIGMSDSPPEQPESLAPARNLAPETTESIDWQSIEQLVSAGQLRDALKELSTHYRSELGDSQVELLNWLDPLAGKVIYSTEHHLFSIPYVCQDGDTLESLAAQWSVPAELIFNINQHKLNNEFRIIPGTEIKMIQGPFNAEVSLGNQQLTLFLGDLYAGRFPIELGNSSVIEPGTFSVVAKSDSGKDYTDGFGKVIPAGQPDNPFGKYWIDLGSRISIHDVNDAAQPGSSFGSVRLSNRDASDVFGILSNGSGVTIVR